MTKKEGAYETNMVNVMKGTLVEWLVDNRHFMKFNI